MAPLVSSVLQSRLILLGWIPCTICMLCIGRGDPPLLMLDKVLRSFCRYRQGPQSRGRCDGPRPNGPLLRCDCPQIALQYLDAMVFDVCMLSKFRTRIIIRPKCEREQRRDRHRSQLSRTYRGPWCELRQSDKLRACMPSIQSRHLDRD